LLKGSGKPNDMPLSYNNLNEVFLDYARFNWRTKTAVSITVIKLYGMKKEANSKLDKSPSALNTG
jgi:hypothetical protein